jgi:hypothetical protein
MLETTAEWTQDLENLKGKEILSYNIETKGKNQIRIPLELKDGTLKGYEANPIANPGSNEQKLKISKDGVLLVEGRESRRGRESNIVDLRNKAVEVEFSADGRKYRAESFIESNHTSKENGECHFSLYDTTDIVEE